MTFKILLVEDDTKTAVMVRFYLERENFTLFTAIDGSAGEKTFLQQQPDLAILDIMLPGAFDGLELCRRIRQNSTIPIIMLTARAEDTDKIIGLGIGADDYLTKPFSPTELIARVKALLRRSYHYSDLPAPAILGGPRLKMDTNRRQVKFDEKIVELTPTEFNLLQILMGNPGWAFTRRHLLEEVWGYGDEAGEETVTAHISNLRQKLGTAGTQLISTKRGVGYAYQEGD